MSLGIIKRFLVKGFSINKYISILFFVLILAGQSFAIESFKNNLLKTDIYKTSSGGFRINLYTSHPYSESVVVNKVNDNQYVILLPETQNSVSQKVSTDKFSDDIKNIDIKTQLYLNNFKGYTKITISTNKPLLIIPQTLVLNSASQKKNEKIAQVQKAQNNIVKKDAPKTQQAIKTALKAPSQTTKTQTVTNKVANKPTQNTKIATAPTFKPVAQKAVSKPQTVAQKPEVKHLNKEKQLAASTAVKPSKQPSVAKKQTVAKNTAKPVEKIAQKAPDTVKNSANAAEATPPANTNNLALAPTEKEQPASNTPTPMPIQPQAAQPEAQPQPPAMPPANNNASFLNIYTMGGCSLAFLFLLLIIAKRRNKNSARAKNNYTNNQPDFMQETSDFNPTNQGDILDSGGSLFSVAQENINQQEQDWNPQPQQEEFSYDEFNSSPQDTSDYTYTQNTHQEVDDLFASEESEPEYSQQDNFGQSNFEQYIPDEPEYHQDLTFGQDNDAEFDTLRNDYQQDFNSEPEFDPQSEFEQERPRTIPTIPTITPAQQAEEIDSLLDEDTTDSGFAEIDESAFVDNQTPEFEQNGNSTSLDNFNDFEFDSTKTEEPSIEELFAEDEEVQEEEIKIVEPFNQKFDESQLEKIKRPEKFEEVKTTPLPETNDIIEETVFEAQPEEQKQQDNGLQNFEDFETVAQPEEVVSSEFEIDDNSGFYVVDYLDFSILVGHIGEEVFILKRFEDKLTGKLLARLNEKKGSTSSYMVKIGGFKAVVEVNPSDMKLLIEL